MELSTLRRWLYATMKARAERLFSFDRRAR